MSEDTRLRDNCQECAHTPSGRCDLHTAELYVRENYPYLFNSYYKEQCLRSYEPDTLYMNPYIVWRAPQDDDSFRISFT